MRFAILGSRGYPSTYSGYETLVRHLGPFLRDAGHDVTVYSRGVGRPQGRGTRADVVDGITRVWTSGVEGKTTSTLSHGLTASLHARRQGFDSALVLNVANGFYLPLLRRSEIPTVVNVDGIEWERDKWNALGKRAFRLGAGLTARYADELVADSRAIVGYWKRTFRRTSHFIPYGADVVTDVPTDKLEALGLAPEGYVLVVARMVPENNTDVLLDALQSTGFRHPAVIVGSAVGRSLLEERLRQVAAMQANVHWLGHVHDQQLLSQLWAHCGAYWHGHSVGGTNPSLLQALGHGAPVIALDTVYNREVLSEDEQLLPAEPAFLAEAITRLLGDATTRAVWSERARDIVASRYRWEDVNQSYLRVLQGLAGEARDQPLSRDR